MKLKIFLILILLCLLNLQTFSQRGGGRSRSSRSSSRSFRSFSKKTSKSPKNKQAGYQDYLILVGVVGVLGYFGYNAKKNIKQRQNQRQITLQKITHQFQKNIQANICTLEEDQRNQKIDWFMTNKWTVQYFSVNDIGKFSMKVTDIVKKFDYIYEIKATGSNQKLGDSNLRGILMFQKNYLRIFFDKVYENREKAGQTGQWNVLIYEGFQDGQSFDGKWYYEGFQNSNEYSGKMKIVHD